MEAKMRNLTLAIDEDILLAARKRALERGTTVNQMVREFLEEVVSRDARNAAAAQRMRQDLDRIGLEVGARDWAREDLYER